MTDQAILDFYRVAAHAERTESLQVNQYLSNAKQKADEWALHKNIPYVVVDMGCDNYQIWAKHLVDKEYKIIYESGGTT